MRAPGHTDRGLARISWYRGLADDRTVDLCDLGLPRIHAHLRQDWHEGPAERVKLVLRVPDVQHREVAAGAEAHMVAAPGWRAGPGLVQASDHVVILGGV